MVATRQDAWTEQDDLYLAEITLRSIRNGETQLAAFEEVAVRLGRTSAACGFRWNSVVRKQYETSVQLAKSQRVKKEKLPKIHFENEVMTEVQSSTHAEIYKEEDFSIEKLISWLQKRKTHADSLSLDRDRYEKKYQQSEEERQRLMIEVVQLKEELTRIQLEYQTMNEDYKTFIQMMDRARKMTFLGDDNQQSPRLRFRMESNGNLEHFA